MQTHNRTEAVSYTHLDVYKRQLFTWKFVILVTMIILSIFFYRPFCKWFCPLGAFYSLFNRFSILNYNVDDHKCISCGKCSRICKMDVDISENAYHTECIRCGECIKAVSYTHLTPPPTARSPNASLKIHKNVSGILS